MNSSQNQKNDKECTKKVNACLLEFIEKLTKNEVSRPIFKFICEAVGGILICRNLVIREMATALMEDSKAPGTVEKRFSVHLQDVGFSDKINFCLLKFASPRIQVYTPIAIDLTDTQRPYANKTPGVEKNYDGSIGKGGKGYKHFGAAAIFRTKEGREILPVYQETFGLNEETKLIGEENPEIDSEYNHFEKCIKSFSETLGGPIGIDVFDRGADDKKYFGCELHYRRWFLIRMCEKLRYVSYKGKNYYLKDLLPKIKWHTKKCRIYDKKKKKWRKRNRQIGWLEIQVEVQFPDGKTEIKDLVLVVVKFKNRKMFLLTNLTIDDAGNTFKQVNFAKMLYESYLLRWGIESCFDMLKNRIDVEKIFSRTYFSAKNLFALAWLALAFVTVALEGSKELAAYLLEIPQRIYKCKVPVCKAFLLFTSLKLLWQRYWISFSFH